MDTLKQLIASIKTLKDKERDILLEEIIKSYISPDVAKTIVNIVCTHLHITVKEINSRTRKAEVVLARHLIMYFARKKTKLSFARIGLFYAERNHSTAINAYNQINRKIKENEQINNLVKLLDKKISSVMNNE